MDIPTLLTHLDNKSAGLQAKMQVSKDKGLFDLYEIFNNEWANTQITIRLLNKAQDDIHFYTNLEVRAKMTQYLLEEVPNLALYFKEESINQVLTDAIGRSFDRLSEEYFKNRIVNLVE